MSDIEFDFGDLARRFAGVVSEAQEQGAVHKSSPPEYAQTAAGRGFTEHGARIASALERIHTQGAWRIANMEATSAAASRQFHQLLSGDEGTASDLGELLRGEL